MCCLGGNTGSLKCCVKDGFMFVIIVSSAFAVIMTIIVMIIRIKSAGKPASSAKIILPPLFMSTGGLMFIFPVFRVSPAQIAEAVLAGLIFSLLLIKTTKLEIRENEIFLKRSNTFLIVLAVLVVIRLFAKLVLSKSVDPGELGGMFWILAFSMLVPWRIMMYRKFRRLRLELQKTGKLPVS